MDDKIELILKDMQKIEEILDQLEKPSDQKL
jgi:hypothetical protein